MSKTSPIKDAKRQLRVLVKKKLSFLSNEIIEAQSRNVTNTVLRLPQIRNAKKIALYMNMPNLEIQTLKLIEECFKQGKQVYLPKCNVAPLEGRKKNYLSMLRMQTFEDVLQLQPQGKYQLLEPLEGEDVMETGGLDLIIIPGVAFTRAKKRLGHGAGFYDEFLNVYYKKHGIKPHLLGVGLHEQLVDDIPKEDHDWDLNSLVIEGHAPF